MPSLFSLKEDIIKQTQDIMRQQARKIRKNTRKTYKKPLKSFINLEIVSKMTINL